MKKLEANKSIQWQRSSNGVSDWSDIPGENSLEYILRIEDIGKHIRFIDKRGNK